MNAGFKEECISLRKQGLSLPEIVERTGRAKTSVYFHIKHLPLSVERVKASRVRAGERIRVFAIARTGKSAKDFRRFDTINPDRALLLGHLIFDGEIIRGQCAYNNRSGVLIRRVERLMKEVYDFEPKWYRNDVTGVTRIAYFNVALSAYLQQQAHRLMGDIGHLSKQVKREFLRAFFDDEGCVSFNLRMRKRAVRGYQKDRRILMLVKGLLADFDIESRINAPNEVVITGKENLIKFEQEIGFTPGVRINGKRSNSVWKKSLEKRIILRRAIASFIL